MCVKAERYMSVMYSSQPDIFLHAALYLLKLAAIPDLSPCPHLQNINLAGNPLRGNLFSSISHFSSTFSCDVVFSRSSIVSVSSVDLYMSLD